MNATTTAHKTDTIKCYECGQEFQWTRADFYDRKPERCQECIGVESERNRSKVVDELTKKIREITPARYRATDTTHPDFNIKLWEKVAAWKPTDERPWLGLVGATGKSKSRCAYLRLAEGAVKMVWKNGETSWRPPSVKAITAYDFSDAVKNQYGDDSGDAKEFLESLKKVDLLLIDDLGKSRNTPAASGELFALIDRRHEENRLTLWTSNLTPEGIVAGMPEEIGLPLAGRIRECSTIFNVK